MVIELTAEMISVQEYIGVCQDKGGEIMSVEDEHKCVAYEVDFIGVPESEAKKDADAICFRCKLSDGTYRIGVYDAGFQAHGEAMVKHINKYYFGDEYDEKPRIKKKIDYVFVSHPHNDHSSGIPSIIEKFYIGCIYMNVPWKYAKELMKMSYVDGRATINSVEKELHEDFPYIAKIEELANQYGIEIKAAFAGTEIAGGRFKILSPSRDYYLSMIVKSKNTKRLESLKETMAIDEAFAIFEKFEAACFSVLEKWDVETLDDDHYKIDAENETSIVLYGFQEGGGMLLLGDAGANALYNANEVAQSFGINIMKDDSFVEIPHHGGRHNVTKSVMNELFGERVANGETNKTAYVSVAEGSDHPRRIIVNAFIRRGFKVFRTSGGVRHHSRGEMPQREGYIKSEDSLELYSRVEAW